MSEVNAQQVKDLRTKTGAGFMDCKTALRESNGDALAVSEDAIRSATLLLSRATGVDAAPEGGCALAVTAELVRQRRVPKDAEVLVFNTGSGASYRF